MGFETCRMTCEDTLETAFRGAARDEVLSNLFKPRDWRRKLERVAWPPLREMQGTISTIQVSPDVTATFADHGKAPPKSRGEEIAEKLEGDWIEEIPVSVIADAIDKAIAEEREACAEIVRRFCGDIGSCDADRIAKAIRDRSNHNE